MLLAVALLACASAPGDPGDPGEPAASAASETVVEPTTRLPDYTEVEFRADGRPNGELAPDADLYLFDLYDGPVRLSAFVGPEGPSRATVVAFMASWCAACVASLPTLKALEDQYGPQDLSIVHLNVDTTYAGRKRASERIREAGLRGPILIAPPPVQRAWMGNSSAVPRYFFVNRAGQILVQDRGYSGTVADLMPRQLAYTLDNPGWTER